MTTEDFIVELFCRVDDIMGDVPKHSQAKLYPSEVVTLALLFAFKGIGNRAFYRWCQEPGNNEAGMFAENEAGGCTPKSGSPALFVLLVERFRKLSCQKLIETRFKIIAQSRDSTMITNSARKWPFVGYPIGKSEPLSERDQLAARKVRVNQSRAALDNWLRCDYLPLFPGLPDRTRLFRLFNSYCKWIDCFMAAPSMIGVIDTYGIELIYPRRSAKQIGCKGKSNWRWIVSGKLRMLLNHLGLVVSRACDTANVYDGTPKAFQALVENIAEQIVVFSDTGFGKQDWHPTNLKPCRRGEWNVRMIGEAGLSMLTTVCHFKKVGHRVWSYFVSRVGYTMALFNLLVSWHGLQPDDNGFVRLSIAEFSLRN